MTDLFGSWFKNAGSDIGNAIQKADSLKDDIPPPSMEGGAGAKRTFTVIVADHGIAVGGKYVGAMPLTAAKKAASKLFAKAKATTRKIHFTLRETTRGSGKQELRYVANKTKLTKPKVIKRGDVEFTLTHAYETRALDNC
jgi:radical SAM superfamily enzyme with C-terminal helix-hairpin-helix motif